MAEQIFMKFGMEANTLKTTVESYFLMTTVHNKQRDGC
jgi:hypothetical protein